MVATMEQVLGACTPTAAWSNLTGGPARLLALSPGRALPAAHPGRAHGTSTQAESAQRTACAARGGNNK